MLRLKTKEINISDEIITPDSYNLKIMDNPTKIIINIKNCIFLDMKSFSIVYYIDPLPLEVIINAPKLKYIDNYNPTYMINNIYKLNCKNKLIMPKRNVKPIKIDENGKFKTNLEYFDLNKLKGVKNIKELNIKNVKYVFGNFEPTKKIKIVISEDNLIIIKKYFKSHFKFKNIKFVD